MKLVNWFLTSLFGLLFWPFQGLDPVWALVVVSFLCGLLMVWVFGKVSNQEAIRRVKNKIRGNLLGVRLYQHDVRIVLRLQGRILRDTLTYMNYSIIPMLVLIVPLLLIIVQLNLHFSLRPLKPGESAVLKARLIHTVVLQENISLENPSGVKVETPGVRIDSEGEVAWRIRAQQPGRHLLTVRVGEQTVEKELYVGDRWGAVSALRSNSLLDLLLYPGEARIDASEKVKSITVQYRPLPISIWGWNVHWLVLFFVLSILVAFIFKGAFGVEL
ncbi:hypothetical protein MYX84_14075 [Acidobacteria bacterium AH-259-O06]|nr:hypothetical protein [Acidobacteria bacterium AH-259-O06]